MLRAGILMPRSTLYPSLGLDIISGLKQYLKQQELSDKIKLIIDNIGFGTDEADVYAKAERMLLQEDADVVIVCADSKIAAMLAPMFTAGNKILLMVNFGANLPESWQAEPTTIIHSLNFCLHTSLTGKLAAQANNKQAINVVSYYDGGYNQCYCMLNAHYNNGGEPVFTHVTQLKTEDFTVVPVIDFLDNNKDVATLLCLFCNREAAMFYEQIAVVQQRSAIHLFVSPMMLDSALKTIVKENTAIQNVQGYIPWHPSLNNAANRSFIDFYTATTSKEASYFSLLGWETGQLLQHIDAVQNSDNNNAVATVQSLHGLSFDSPRGFFTIDASTHHSYGSSYLAICKNNMEVNVTGEVENITVEWNYFIKTTLPQAESSAWKNTYLCI